MTDVPSSVPPIHPALLEHSKMFESSRIIKVTDHVYVGFNFAIANMIMVEGTNGIVIIDTTESGEIALKIMEEFRKITAKPITAIIYTHFHLDHHHGTEALLTSMEDGGRNVRIFAHSTFTQCLLGYSMTSESTAIGGYGQFGFMLEQGTERVCCGLGSQYYVEQNISRYVLPTDTFNDTMSVELAGITFTLIHTPGETSDQIGVWIPEWKVFMPGDNIYKTFPNLYAIRGTPPRNAELWYQSLDKIRHLKPKHLVPSHTEPISGEENVYEIVTYYRDAIQFIYDQTVRHLNNGSTIDEMVEKVRLPSILASHPYLQEHYGMTVWSVRSVISGKIGWFDRDPVNLFPLSKQEEAKKLQDLLNADSKQCESAVDKILDTAERIAKDADASAEEIQWSLKLSMYASRLSKPDSQSRNRALSVASTCLFLKAAAAWNPLARNTFLMNRKLLSRPNAADAASFIPARIGWIKKWPISFVMEKLRFQFKAEACDENKTMTLIFDFPDVGQQHCYTMRHCVLEYQNTPELVPEKYDVKVKCNSDVWRDVLANIRGLDSVKKSGDLALEGHFDHMQHFLNLLDIGPNLTQNTKSV